MKKFLLPSLALMVAILGMGIMSQVSAASPAAIDPLFSVGPSIGVDNSVYGVASQSDGKFLLGGQFTYYKGVARKNIVRLYSDGSIDTSFNIGNGFNAYTRSLLVQSDGKILVGGAFTSYKGTTANRIIRLNSDGTKDTSFNIGNGFNNTTYPLAIQSDGKIIVGGDFTTYSGTTVNRIVRLNSDGTIDSSFNIGNGFNSQVRSIAIQSDGKIIVGGGFTTYKGITSNSIIRLNSDGSKDDSFNIGNGVNGGVRSVAIQSDGKIIVGGYFTSYSGVASSCIVRLNSNGTRDASFIIGTGFVDQYGNSGQGVDTLKIQSDGKIIVGGMFAKYKGEVSNRIIRLNADGTKDSSFNIGNGFDNTVLDLTFQNNGIVLVVGEFTNYNGGIANRFTSLNSYGIIDTLAIGNGFNNQVRTLAEQNDGKILVGGDFTAYGGFVMNRIVRLNTDGTTDSTFNIGSGFNVNSVSVKSIAIQSDGKILVGGQFTTYKSITSNRIIRLNSDGSKDDSFNIGDGFDSNMVNTIAIQSDGKILVGGDFTTYSGTSTNRIVRLNTNGTIDDTFNIGGGFDNYIEIIKTQSDGKILVGGMFSTYKGLTAAGLVRLNSDGTIDDTFNVSGIEGDISSIVVQSDGKILLGGGFMLYGKYYILRINADGTDDTSFNPPSASSQITALGIQNDGKIIVGGGIYRSIGRLNTNGSNDSSFNVGEGFPFQAGRPLSILVKNNGGIMIGGDFSTYNGIPVSCLVSLYGDTTNIVTLPNSTDSTTINNSFTTKGYTQSGTDLLGATAISLSDTDGNIPSALNLKNNNIKLALPANTQFKQADNTTNFNGIISVPSVRSTSSINNETVISAFKVGSSSESIKLAGGLATLSVPAPGKTVGDNVKIYYSEDNGVSWPTQANGTVTNVSGSPYVVFTTNHFTDFAITTPIPFSGSFTINNDAASTTGSSVTLNISTNPTAAKMRFSNDGTTRPSRENYATTKSRTLPGTYGTKTVYAQFDADGDGTSDISINDSITYTNLLGTLCEGTCGDLTLQVLSGNSYCQYGTTLNFGTTGSSYSARSLSTGFVASGGSTARFCEDKQGLGTRALTIQSSAIVNTTTNVSAHTIPATSVSVKNPNAYIAQGACTFASGDSHNERIAIDSAKPILGKIGTVGEGCKITTDNVSLKVDLVAAQAIGQYSGTLTITVPNF